MPFNQRSLCPTLFSWARLLHWCQKWNRCPLEEWKERCRTYTELLSTQCQEVLAWREDEDLLANSFCSTAQRSRHTPESRGDYDGLPQHRCPQKHLPNHRYCQLEASQTALSMVRVGCILDYAFFTAQAAFMVNYVNGGYLGASDVLGSFHHPLEGFRVRYGAVARPN